MIYGLKWVRHFEIDERIMHFYLAHLPEHNEAELAALQEFKGSLYCPKLIPSHHHFQTIKAGLLVPVLVQFQV